MGVIEGGGGGRQSRDKLSEWMEQVQVKVLGATDTCLNTTHMSQIRHVHQLTDNVVHVPYNMWSLS